MKATSIKQLAMMIMVIVKNHIYGMKKLKPNHYLKIKEKLDTVKSYEEVKKTISLRKR